MNAVHGRSDSILEPQSSERSGSIDCQDAPSVWQKMSEAPDAHRGGRRQEWATPKPERLVRMV